MFNGPSIVSINVLAIVGFGWSTILAESLIGVGKAEDGTFYISAPSLPCYAERKTYR